MIIPTLSLTEANVFQAFGTFLQETTTLKVIRGQVNRVAEPEGDFVVMWPLSQQRLATNITSYYDSEFTGSISGTTLTVTAVTRLDGNGIQPGQWLTDTSGTLDASTVVVKQLTGTTGGVGTYEVSVSQAVASETMYADQRADMVQTEIGIQIDIHGPNSADNCRIIECLDFSSLGEGIVQSLGFDLDLLYCGNARQVPFINAARQFEERWTMDCLLQTNPVVGNAQQFADVLDITVVNVDSLA